MKKGKGLFSKTVSAALAASMIFSGTAVAAPIDELNEIMEAQMTEKDSLMEETLDFSGFSETQKENGIQVQADFGLSEKTLIQMGLDKLVSDGGNLSINTQIDPVLKKWLFEIAVGMSKDSSVLDLGLYGDEEKLALKLPQFFAGAISLHAGKLRGQYEESEWSAMIGEMPPEIPEIEMKFYPDFKAINEDTSLGGIEENIEQYTDDIEIEKTEDGEETVYKLLCKSEDIVEIYREIVNEFMSVFTESGLMTNSDVDDFEDDMDQMFDEMASMLGEEVEVLFHVKDNLVERITYGLSIDTSDFVVDEANPEESDTIMQADESFEGTIDYEIIFVNPENALSAMDINMKVADEDGTEYAQMAMGYRVETDGSVEKTAVNMKLTDGEESVYEGTPFVMTFDSATGDFDILIEIEDAFNMMLDSTFTEIEKGKGFRWIVDEISLFDGGINWGINGEVSVNADPGEIQEPQEERELLAMTQGEIIDFVNEVQANAAAWAAQFVPETEIAEE